MDNNNYSYSTYPDSNTSTPRSREVDCENDSYDEQIHNRNPNYKVKLMCSYGGKILPRPHDNQLTYIGGDTKILTVDRNIRYGLISQKLNSLIDTSHACFKYQLPGEDLDALISVTNDEDLEHMMTEYDRIYRSSVKPVRLRVFMFPLLHSTLGGGGGGESKTEQQWFVDALNAVQISSAEGSLPMSENADFLFGFEKGQARAPAMLKVHNVSSVVVAQTNVKEVAHLESECGSEDSTSNSNSNSNSNNNSNNKYQVISDPVVSPVVEIPRQMHEYQRMPIASHEQMTINDPRAYYGDYHAQKIQPQYWQEQRHMTAGGYQMSMAGTESPVYIIPSSAGVYPSTSPAGAQTLRPTIQVNQGQGYYGMQRMPDLYREQQPRMGTYQETIGMMNRTQAQGEMGYGQVYYTTSQGGMSPAYQPMVAAQGIGLPVNQEGKMVFNPNKVP
ncbi:hypothetical protein QVD17_01199 [Tagetes erecta]|uniref:PB1 domain-containing protein n=1 Tax=Tagetes erecta TaxID=13708 RepID=A0AAD8P848_TARER|nr:hypothetical protein QVD17_01199 [Tagetes erecta]